MNPKKIDYAKQLTKIGKRVAEASKSPSYEPKPDVTFNPITPASNVAPQTQYTPSAPKEKCQKICPFRSLGTTEGGCTSRCKLFRNNAAGHNCPFQEIRSISWKLNGLIEFVLAFAQTHFGFELKESNKEKNN
jgi:hypothetical protein